MKMTAVKSEAMTHIGHDGKDLHVTYRGGKTYVHPNVPAHKFESLMAAKSKGTFMRDNVRAQHPGVAK